MFGQIEKRRSWLVQFLIILIMTFLSLILALTWNIEQAMLVRGLVVLALLSCLYTIAQERTLKKRHDGLLREVAGTRRRVDKLDRELKSGKVEFVRLEGRLQELTSLYRAISTVNAVVEHADTFDAVLRAAIELTGGNCGSLMMVDDERKHLVFASSVGLDEEIVAATEQPLGEGIAGWVAEHGQPVLLNGAVEENPEFTNVRPRAIELDTAISIPLRLGAFTIGVLNLGSTEEDEKQAFSNDELRFAYLFAQHASVAIDRARLLEEQNRLRTMISS